jgi:hypothetical protein
MSTSSRKHDYPDARLWRTDLAGLAIVAALTAGAYLLQIAPALSRNAQAKAQSAELLSRQSKARELERTVQTLTDDLGAAQRAAAESDLKLHPASELNRTLARLTELASENGLQVDMIESTSTTTAASGSTAVASGHVPASVRYATVPIRLSGRGGYRSCAAFLNRLRGGMPDMGIHSIELTATGVNADATATFVFHMHWYAQPQPDGDGK